MIREVWAFVWNDIKTDIQFLKRVVTGKFKFRQEIDFSELRKKDIIKMLQKSWLWYLIIIMAFLCGFYYASQYYQNICNQMIYDLTAPKAEYITNNFTFNIT